MGTVMIAGVLRERGVIVTRKILTTDKSVFTLPTVLDTSIDYNPDTLIEECEWFCLSEFSAKEYCFSFLLQEEFSSVDYDELESNDFGKIVFVCGFRDGFFFFQRITPARQVNQKRIFFGTQYKYEESSSSIVINEFADAIYCTASDKLFFRKLRDISAIFVGIDDLFREATEKEVTSFLGNDFIELEGDFSSEDVKTNNRKRIVKVQETLNTFSDAEKKKIFDYTKHYCPELANANGRFTISDEGSLKSLLHGIEQRYYTTLIGEEQRLANSIIPLKQGGHP